MKPMSLCQFPLPGSHDAGSYGKINARSRTQRASIAEQLELGVRYFDFRLIVDEFVYFSHHGSDHSRDNPYTAKVLDPNTNYLFKQIREFCDSHVGEIVILNFGDFVLHWNVLCEGLLEGADRLHQARFWLAPVAPACGCNSDLRRMHR